MPISDIDRRTHELRLNGITIIEDFLDEETCDSLRESIVSSVDSRELTQAGDFDERDQLANAGETIVNERMGTDEGMLDIFNIDVEFEFANDIKYDETVNQIINDASGKEYSPKGINAYIRRSVTNPSPYHADGYHNFSTFVYLTDVPDTSHGPFSYVEGTHDVSMVEKFFTILINRMKGNGGAPRGIVPDPSEALHATAPKGTLIIANNAGYHRGYPQQEGRERVLLTTYYKPAGSHTDPVVALANRLGNFLK